MRAYDDLPELPRMTVDEFLRWWGREAPDGRYELVDGEVRAMAPPANRHTRAVGAIYRAFDAALRTKKSPCEAFVTGPGVKINDANWYEPDVGIDCEPDTSAQASSYTKPVVVVEIVSPSSEKRDQHEKLIGYLKVPSIAHYLIVKLEQRLVVHHTRDGEAWRTTFHKDGTLGLDPPGVTLDLAEIFPSGG